MKKPDQKEALVLKAYKLELLAVQRVANGALGKTSTQREVIDSFGITDEDLAALGEVEIG